MSTLRCGLERKLDQEMDEVLAGKRFEEVEDVLENVELIAVKSEIALYALTSEISSKEILKLTQIPDVIEACYQTYLKMKTKMVLKKERSKELEEKLNQEIRERICEMRFNTRQDIMDSCYEIRIKQMIKIWVLNREFSKKALFHILNLKEILSIYYELYIEFELLISQEIYDATNLTIQRLLRGND